MRLTSTAGKFENLISSKHKCIFLYRKLDQSRPIHTIHPSPVVCIYSGTLPSPLFSLVLCVGETDEENIKMSWERNATGSLRTWAASPVGLRPQQHCHCPSQKGWKVDKGQLDPNATKQTKGLQTGQEEAWRWISEKVAGSAFSQCSSKPWTHPSPKCQTPKGASSTPLTPCREFWLRGSTKEKKGPAMAKFLVCGEYSIPPPRLVPTTPVSSSDHYPIICSLIRCEPSTNAGYYYCCCHHSYYRWREWVSWLWSHLPTVI